MEQSSAGSERTAAWVKQNSHLARVGLKGPHAAAWLQSRSIPIPERANSWIAITPDEQDIVVRLGTTEFFLEQAPSSEKLQPLASELATPIAGVYPVLREDRAFVLGGAAADAVLAEMCNVNFSALRETEREALMTMMIGVAVTVVPQGSAARRRYRIWCDPSYGDYLWSSLQDVASTYK
jgi:sarcosine oxidase subunit gamma